MPLLRRDRTPDETPGTRPPSARGRRSAAFGDFMGEEGAKGALVATVSTVVFFGLVIWLIGSSENWPRVRDQFFNPDDFRESWPSVLRGFWLNVEIFVYAVIAIPIVSLLIALMRSLRGPAFFPVRMLAVVYIDLLRGIPTFLLIVLLGFGVPSLQLDGVPNGALFWAVVALVLSYSAYTAEILRSGVDAVPESQRSSARALGLTQIQTLRFAILPQAVRNVVPALMNTVVSLQKDVALVSVVGIRDALRNAEIYTSRTFNYTSYIVATVLFLLWSVPLTRFVDWYIARDRARRSQTQV